MAKVQVDARGRSCPEPVLLTKKVLNNKPSLVEVLVDNTTARDNVLRLAKNSGYEAEVSAAGTESVLLLKKR